MIFYYHGLRVSRPKLDGWESTRFKFHSWFVSCDRVSSWSLFLLQCRNQSFRRLPQTLALIKCVFNSNRRLKIFDALLWHNVRVIASISFSMTLDTSSWCAPHFESRWTIIRNWGWLLKLSHTWITVPPRRQISGVKFSIKNSFFYSKLFETFGAFSFLRFDHLHHFNIWNATKQSIKLILR